MKIKLIVIGLAAVITAMLVSTPVQTQGTHPCDLPVLTSATVAKGVTFVWNVCLPPPGQPNSPDGIVVYVNGVARPDLALTPGSTTTPNAAGQVPYLASLNLTNAATYTVETTGFNVDPNRVPTRGESPKSTPFALGVVDVRPVPPAPKNTQS
jgi:hypothetical protein